MSMSKPKVIVAARVALDEVLNINWKACCFCQKLGGGSLGPLTCPANNPVQSRKNLGYKSIGENLEKLRKFNYKLQCGLPVEALFVESDIETSLQIKNARWHKKCSLKFLAPKFDDLLQAMTVTGISEHGSIPKSKLSESDSLDQSMRRPTRSSLPLVNAKNDVCFLCKSSATTKYPLRHCATDSIYRNVKQCAEKLNDTELLAVLSEGDLVSIEGKYHLICLARLYNRTTRHSCVSGGDYEQVMCSGIAFANLLVYIQSKLNENPSILFRMGEILHMYRERLTQLLGVPEKEIDLEHTTRFRQKLLAHFPSLQADKSGREYVLKKEGTNILSALHREDQDEDALVAHFFLRKIRKTIKETKVCFDGSFKPGCEEACIPAPLLAVINTLLYGSPVHTQCRATQPALTICQLILLNFHEKTPMGDIVRNKKEREPPLPLYMGLSSYGKSRDKARIEEMHNRGISVSPNRIMEVTSQLCRTVISQSKEKGVMAPSTLRHGLFTVAAVDNIDINPSSTSSSGSGFHGTSITIFQSRTSEGDGLPVSHISSYLDLSQPGVRSVPELPEFYSKVPDCVLPDKQPSAPQCSDQQGFIPEVTIGRNWREEKSWLNHVNEFLQKPYDDQSGVNVSWASFHAAKDSSMHTPALNALLPLFHEKSTNPGMIKHAMCLVKKTSHFLNESQQQAVLCGDQPIFTLMKLIQWNWPDEFGEKSFVVMLGPLHIEQAFLKVLGQLLEDSGWVNIVSQSEVTTSGSAEGLLKVSHITKSRALHQKTAAVLFSLLSEAFENSELDDEITFDEWIKLKAGESPTFKYWLTVLNLEVLLFFFLRAIRTGNFQLYKETLKSMAPLFFFFDHYHYSRWLSVHIFDMEHLQDNAPIIYHNFQRGHFVERKTGRPFSAMGIDQAHEQNNGTVKAQGGAVGLTEDPSALRRWTIGGPEVKRLLEEFNSDEPDELDTHHEQKPHIQQKFVSHCLALKESFLNFENPFLVSCDELIALDSRRVASKEAVNSLYSLEHKGLSLYQAFVQERFVNKKKSVFDTVPKVQCKIFTLPSNKVFQNSPVNKLQNNLLFYSRLFIVSTVRDLKLSEFFRFENQLCPPSLSWNGTLRTGVKADLVKILEQLVPKSIPPLKCDGIVFDGAFLVHQLKPKSSVKNMSDYCCNFLTPYLRDKAKKLDAKRIDVVWDQYHDHFLKKARVGQGTEGVRLQDLPRKGGCPKNWESYLQNSKNKQELFTFLAQELITTMKNEKFVTNVADRFDSSKPQCTSLYGASCAAMGEADGRIILHLKDMVEHGAKDIVICCSDTDILVLGVSFYHSLQRIGLKELWFLFGVGAHRRFIPAHQIAEELGVEKANALRGFHTYSGCDLVSFFFSKGKKSAWLAWKNQDVTLAFQRIGQPVRLSESNELEEEIVSILENYTISLYTSDTSVKCIDEARKNLFCSGGRPVTCIPPTKSALVEHIKRAAFQAGQIWGKADQLEQTLTSPEKWGWTQDSNGCWEPVWSTLPPIWSVCRELDRCGCATSCDTQRCCCRRHELPCTPACKKCKARDLPLYLCRTYNN